MKNPRAAVAFAVGLFASGIAHPGFSRASSDPTPDGTRKEPARTGARDPDTITKNNIRQAFLGLKLYAADFDGHYPAKLDDLVTEMIIDLERVLDWENPSTGKKERFTYVPGLTDSHPRDLVLLATPGTNAEGLQTVVMNDGLIKLVPPAEAAQLLKASRAAAAKEA